MDLLVVRRGVVLALCLPVLLLGGCGDGDEESGPGPVTPSGSASSAESGSVEPSTGGSVPIEELPASEVEPEEFVRAWVEAYDEATFTGDTTRMLSMSSNGCLTCFALADSLDAIATNGGSIDVNEQPTEIISSELVGPVEASGVTQVTLELKFPGGVTVESAGAEPIEFEPVPETWAFYIEVRDDRWVVQEIGVE